MKLVNYLKNKVTAFSHLYYKIYARIQQHQWASFCIVNSVIGAAIYLLIQLSAWLFAALIGLDAIGFTAYEFIMILLKPGSIENVSAATVFYIALACLCSVTTLLTGSIYFLRQGYPYRHYVGTVWLILGSILLLFWVSDTLFLALVGQDTEAATPFKFFQRWLYFGDSAVIHRHLLIATVVPFGLTGFGLFLWFKNKPPAVYGDAHFATLKEATHAGLFAETGLWVGKAWGKDIIVGGFEHVFLFAPTGGGKTTSLILPNFLTWSGSIVGSDIKNTLFEKTSGIRAQHGHACYRFSPGLPNTHCYNPLAIIEDNHYTRIDEIQKIAAILIPDNPKSEPIWQVQSRLLFVALTLYVLDTPGLEKSIGQVVRLVKEAPNFGKFIQEELAREDLDPVCRNNFYKFYELHEKTRNSILATFISYFELFDNPLIEAATARSDFDIRELRRKPMTIYVGVTNDNLVRLSPLLTLFYQQVSDVLTRQLPGADEPYPVLFLMDEFPALRRMESFHKNIGVFREYQLRVVIIAQELSQLYEIYGRDGAKIFVNAKLQIAYTQNDEETCQFIANRLGTKTITITNKSRKNKFALFEQDAESDQLIKRELMLPSEIRQLPENKQLIMVQGHSSVYANKCPYYKDKRFMARIIPPIAVPSILACIKPCKAVPQIVDMPPSVPEQAVVQRPLEEETPEIEQETF